MAPQNIGQESIPLVSAVEADFFPQQTTADADTDRSAGGIPAPENRPEFLGVMTRPS